MDWIKKNYDRVILLVAALLLLGLSGLLVKNVLGFHQTFSSIRPDASGSTKVREADLAKVSTANASVASPSAWKQKGSLFVSAPYILQNGILVTAEDKEGMWYPPVPNVWLLQNDLDLLNGNVINEDPDKDRFTNKEEFLGESNPRDPKSHPSYLTKLKLLKVDSKPFRLVFAAHQDSAEGKIFQINTVDVKQPSQFLKLGDAIPGTRFKIIGFEKKEVLNPRTGSMEDVSELTIEDLQTNGKLVLVLLKMANSPDAYATFRYLWEEREFKVKKDETFTLAPVEDVTYKLIDTKTTEAVIENLKTGEKTTLHKEQ